MTDKNMNSTRDRILQTLLYHPKSSINELAELVGINGISVRHHLTNLQADGLVEAEEERHGVGRPRLVYELTEEGHEHFPTRYLRLANRLLEQVKETLPKQTLNQLFSDIAKTLAADYAEQVENLPMEEKLETVRRLLAEEGFVVEWEQRDDGYLIHEITCPYYHIGLSHPEVCAVDQTLISTVLSIPVEKMECVLSGDRYCTYAIQKKVSGEKSK